MDSLENSLSWEQNLNHRIFGDQVKQLSLEQAQDLLLQMHRQMMYKENLYQQLFLSQEKDIFEAALAKKNHQ